MGALSRLKHQQRLGRRPSEVSATQLKVDALKASDWRQRAHMVGSAMASVARTRIMNITVPDDIAQSNRATCESCPSGHFFLSADKHPACSECGCSGHMMMASKWSDPMARCPKGHWDNTIISQTKDGKRDV